jgi:hypothetical protein
MVDLEGAQGDRSGLSKTAAGSNLRTQLNGADPRITAKRAKCPISTHRRLNTMLVELKPPYRAADEIQGDDRMVLQVNQQIAIRICDGSGEYDLDGGSTDVNPVRQSLEAELSKPDKCDGLACWASTLAGQFPMRRSGSLACNHG